MIVKPKFRGFICTTAHPVGCEKIVKEQIDYVKSQGKINGPRNVLIIGASSGYGLSTRITSTFGSGANTIGVFFERPSSDTRTASAGWYNTAAFEKYAIAEGYYAKSINGDAFSNEVKEKTIYMIKKDLGKIDLVVYSLASPRRTHPITGETFCSVLKPINETFTNKHVDFHTGNVSQMSIEAATEDEMKQTVAVMGGEDWEMWIDALIQADVLTSDVKTVAYSYIGSKITYPVYREGTIGMAKSHLEDTAERLNKKLNNPNASAYVSINKALVTQASSAIPIVPLYVAIMYKIMKEKGIHEGCIEQIYRLFKDNLYDTPNLDEKGRIRIDDWELRDDVQEKIFELWDIVNTENLDDISDIKGLRSDFFKLFGFELDIDYDKDVDINIKIPSIED